MNEEEKIRAIGLRWIEDTIAAYHVQVQITKLQERHRILRLKQMEAENEKRNKQQDVLSLTIPNAMA